jgi:hypothetical protein
LKKKTGWRAPRFLRIISNLDWAGECQFEKKNQLESPKVFEIHFNFGLGWREPI